MNSKKNWINAFCLICIFHCVPFFLSAQEIEPSSLLQLAHEKLERADYAEAALAFEKANYFGGKEVEFEALTGKAMSQKYRGDFEGAIKNLRRIRHVGLNDEDAFRLHYEIAICSMLAAQFIEARSELLVLEQKIDDKEKIQDLLFLKIIVANELREWKEGKVLMEEYAAIKKLDSNFVDEMYGSKFPKIKDPHKAELWSTFIPGAGQMYAGSFWKGLLSTGTQVAFLGFGAYHLFEKFYFTAFISGFALFQAFYFGGQQQAATLTISNNQKRADAYNQRMTKRLLAIEKTKF